MKLGLTIVDAQELVDVVTKINQGVVEIDPARVIQITQDRRVLTTWYVLYSWGPK